MSMRWSRVKAVSLAHPHGSQNARLLNVPNINTLANQCHSAVGAGNIHGISAGQRTSALHGLPHHDSRVDLNVAFIK